MGFLLFTIPMLFALGLAIITIPFIISGASSLLFLSLALFALLIVYLAR